MKQSKFDKKYKALMLDIDGTIIESSGKEILPTKKVKTAINKADKLIHVGLATSRPYQMVSHIINHLSLSGPCILTGGAQVFDPVKNKVVYEKQIDLSSVNKVYKIINKYGLIVLDDGRGLKRSLKEAEIKNPTQLWIEIENQENVDAIFSELSNISSISVHKMISRFDGKMEMIIGHTEATKQHGIQKVAEILRIKTHDIIGVGDGYNDFPLLMACGLKIAMGNAVPELKEIADYIAPSVEEDGVADIIEKFILKNEKHN